MWATWKKSLMPKADCDLIYCIYFYLYLAIKICNTSHLFYIKIEKKYLSWNWLGERKYGLNVIVKEIPVVLGNYFYQNTTC